MRKMLMLVLTLATVTAASLAPVPKAEAACAWQCGLCGVYCPCSKCAGPFPVCPCG